MLGLDDTERNQILDLDLIDYVYVTKSYVVGSPSSRTELAYISGVSHDIRPGSHVVTFSVESAQQDTFLVLADTVAGKLDFGLLDF